MKPNEGWLRKGLSYRSSTTSSAEPLGLVLTPSLIPLGGVNTHGLSRTSMRPQMGWQPLEH